MSFTRLQAIHHLLRIGLLTPAQLLDEEIGITEWFGRNRLLRIDRSSGASITIKQPREADTLDAATMWTEAAIFWLTANDSDFARLAPWVPRFFHYHEPDKVLTIEFVAGDDLMSRLIAGSVTPALFRELGAAFATLHGPVSRALSGKPERRLFGTMLPWALCLGSAQTRYAPPSQAAVAIHDDLLRRPSLVAALSAARAAWRGDAVIHGDAKAMNVVIPPDGSIRLIDWEIAGLGDRLWDLAGIVHSLIVPNPLIRAEPLAQAIARAAPWLEALWEGYCGADPQLTLTGAERDAILRLTGIRLVQTSLERAHVAPSLDETIPSLLDIAFDLMARPEAARDTLRWAA
jgi:Ser/Thr protein kinase RdoA (MazF antagonist)